MRALPLVFVHECTRSFFFFNKLLHGVWSFFFDPWFWTKSISCSVRLSSASVFISPVPKASVFPSFPTPPIRLQCIRLHLFLPFYTPMVLKSPRELVRFFESFSRLRWFPTPTFPRPINLNGLRTTLSFLPLVCLSPVRRGGLERPLSFGRKAVFPANQTTATTLHPGSSFSPSCFLCLGIF